MNGLDFVVTAVFAAWLMVWIFHCVQQMKDINELDVRLKLLENLLNVQKEAEENES